MPLSYVSITEPTSFRYQQAINVSDVLLKIMMDTYKGYSPDVDTLIASWASTSLYWSEQCRVLEATPAVVFTDIGKWQHE